MARMAVDGNRYKVLKDVSQILEHLGRQRGEGLGVSELARSIGASPSRVSRLLRALGCEGLVHREPETGKYWLGPRLCQLGLAKLLNEPLRPLIVPHLEQMARDTGLMASWGTGSYAAGMTFTSDRLTLSASGGVVRLMGAMLPFFASSYGRVCLAYMDEDESEQLLNDAVLIAYTRKTIIDMDELRQVIDRIRIQGYASDEEEMVDGIRAVSVPILGKAGKLYAVMNLTQELVWTSTLTDDIPDYIIKIGKFISCQCGHSH